MIIVIADDITGAAELAGIAMRYGFRVLVASEVLSAVAADVLVIYTNTRSLPEEEAVAVMMHLTQKAKALQPALFYKKTDSVLRGHVVAEMQGQLKVLGIAKGLLVPVNPALGRTIKDGCYYVHGQPVHEAGFANDPEFPIHSSAVKNMLGAKGEGVNVKTKTATLPTAGITIGEAQTAADVDAWAIVDGTDVLFAGGASFFGALLRHRFAITEKLEKQNVRLAYPVLFVSGTTYAKNIRRIQDLLPLVNYMPEAVFASDVVNSSELKKWSHRVVETLHRHNLAIMAVQDKKIKSDPVLLREKTGEGVKQVVQQTAVKELLIEGGSTAYAIIQKLGWQLFIPTDELAQGVVRMQLAGKSNVHLTIKPGSYDWPEEWNFPPPADRGTNRHQT